MRQANVSKNYSLSKEMDETLSYFDTQLIGMKSVHFHFFSFYFILILLASCSKKDTPDPPALPPQFPGCINVTSPGLGSFVIAGTTISLSWSAGANASSYDVYLSIESQAPAIIGTNITGTSLSFTVPAAANARYQWYVQPKSTNGNAVGCAATMSNFIAITIQPPVAFGFYVVGYFPNYRNLSEVPDVKFRMCNVVNYAFFSVNAGGTLDVNNAALVPQVIQKAKTNGAKILVSLNEVANGNFKNAASTAGTRNALIKDIMNKVRQYGFDGVDVDWEFPRTDDGTHITYAALMKELSDSLHRDAKYYLSAAITAGKYSGVIRDAIQTEVFAYADWFNIMSYDDFDATVPFRHHSPYALSVTSLNYWLTTRGMPASKCVLGFPAYGRASGIIQTGTTMSYRTILTQGGSSQSDSALVSQGNFVNYKIYYNGQPTAKLKTMLAKQRANGVMMWELWHDAPDDNSLLKAACDTIGRRY